MDVSRAPWFYLINNMSSELRLQIKDCLEFEDGKCNVQSPRRKRHSHSCGVTQVSNSDCLPRAEGELSLKLPFLSSLDDSLA